MQVCARSSKFSLFDPAKEMAYIQMSRKEKSKGEAAINLIGSQVSAIASALTLHHQCMMKTGTGAHSVLSATLHRSA